MLKPDRRWLSDWRGAVQGAVNRARRYVEVFYTPLAVAYAKDRSPP